MLGFGALGELALGEIPGVSVDVVTPPDPNELTGYIDRDFPQVITGTGFVFDLDDTLTQ